MLWNTSYLITSGLLAFYFVEILTSIANLDLILVSYYAINLVPFILFLVYIVILAIPLYNLLKRKMISVYHKYRKENNETLREY